MANHEITNALISDKTARKLVKALEDVRVETPIADNLVTDSASVALSAGQGVVLKALVDAKVAKADVVNDLNQTTAGTVLDGRQGKVLGDAINAINTQVSNVTGILDAQLHMPISWRTYSNILDAIKANWATITANTRFFSANVLLSGGSPYFLLAQRASDYQDYWFVITIYNDGGINIYYGDSQSISLVRTI